MSSRTQDSLQTCRLSWSVISLSRLLLQLLLISTSVFAVLGLTLKSVPQLEDTMYEDVDGAPCVRLLNLSGQVGCANPGREKFHASLLRFTDSNFNLTTKSAVLVPSSALHQVLYRAVRDPVLAEHVAAVIVEFDLEDASNVSGLDLGFSPDSVFPQAEFSAYGGDYVWNKPGSGILQENLNFPVFLLSNESMAIVQKVATANEIHNLKHPLHVAEFDFVMQTTKSGTLDSESCLKEWSCLPLGGYSVWSSLPPMNLTSPPVRPIILVVCSMDSASLFREMSTGADSALSGMIAMLAAVDSLSKVVDTDDFQKQVVFLVLTGEAWGYLGSRRFLAELAAGDPSVDGLSVSRIRQVLEVGSIGQAMDTETLTLYAHKPGSEIPASTQEILDALQMSASSLTRGKGFDNVEVKLANQQNPGIPPSSLMSFLQKDVSVSGVVLEEFDEAFKNRMYHSHFDNADNLKITAVTRTAALIARSVYILGNSASNLTSVDSIEVNTTLVSELVSCLLSRTPPGMNCNLVMDLITPSKTYANHYVGVLMGRPSATPYLENVDDTARFVWNFLASRTGKSKHQPMNSADVVTSTFVPGLECTQTCTGVGEICVGSTTQKKGSCILSTTRYVPAYSPRLHYDVRGWRLRDVDPGDTMSEVDPVWTESFWKSTSLRLYLRETSRHDGIILLLGLLVITGSVLGIFTTKSVLWKRLKQA